MAFTSRPRSIVLRGTFFGAGLSLALAGESCGGLVAGSAFSTGGRGVYFAPECGCDGGNVDIDSTWPAAPSPVTSFGPCTAAAVPRDAATE